MGMVQLTDVPGIGEATAAKLRDAGIGSADDLAEATIEALTVIPGFGNYRAIRVRRAAERVMRRRQAAEAKAAVAEALEPLPDVAPQAEKPEKKAKKMKKAKKKDDKKKKADKKKKCTCKKGRYTTAICRTNVNRTAPSKAWLESKPILNSESRPERIARACPI